MKQLLFASFLVLNLPAVAMPQEQPRVTAMQAEKQKDPRVPEDFVVGQEDELSIVVWREAELSAKVVVRPDGKIGVPLLHDIQASGLTTTQLREQITEGLSKYIKDPQVTVIVSAIRSQKVSITGAISKPGVYTLGAPMTVMELLVQAGGLADFAKSENIQILRSENGKTNQFRFNYKRFLEGKDYQQNILLKNRDMVIVP